MPNYGLVVNSTFQPFTYQELAAPLDRQELYHEKLAEEYDKLSSQADVLEAMGANDKDKSSGAYNRYKAYSDKLRKEADDLYKFGLNTESRQRLSDLRRIYNTDIVPIQNAWTKREKEADDQMKAQLQNPSLMFTRDARSTTLDDYVRNPTGGYGVINGANITAQMAGMAKNLAKQVRSGNKQNIDAYTYNYIEKYGLDENLIRNWQDSPTLSAMYKQVMESNGVTPEALNGSSNMQSIIDKSTGYAEMGMWNAMGEDKSHIVEDYGARLEAQTAKEIAVAQAKEAAKQGDNMPDIPNWAEERAGIKTSEGYVTNAPEVLGSLKGGYDGLKASVFGRYTNSVNPMAIYEDYQNELKKHTKREHVYENGTDMIKNVPDENAAKRATLSKYSKYGVSDILSKDQYDILKGMGYTNTSKFGNRFSTLEKDLDKLATQYTRYSTKMSGYDLPSDAIRTTILRMPDAQFKSGKMWDMKDDGSLGSPVTNKNDLNLKTNDNTKGNEVTDIQYDPQNKGKILVTFSDGTRKIASPDIIDAQLTRALNTWETAGRDKKGYDPRIITGMISKWLNTYNKTQGKTSSKE